MGCAEIHESCLTWRHHPAHHRPRQRLLALIYLVAATAALQVGFRTPWLTLLGAVALLAASAEFLLASSYTLNAAGVEQQGPLGRRQMAWPAVRRALVVDQGPAQGVLLSPVAEAGLAQRWRSLWLPATAEVPLARLVAWVEQHATERQRPVAATEVAHG